MDYLILILGPSLPNKGRHDMGRTPSIHTKFIGWTTLRCHPIHRKSVRVLFTSAVLGLCQTFFSPRFTMAYLKKINITPLETVDNPKKPNLSYTLNNSSRVWNRKPPNCLAVTDETFDIKHSVNLANIPMFITVTDLYRHGVPKLGWVKYASRLKNYPDYQDKQSRIYDKCQFQLEAKLNWDIW